MGDARKPVGKVVTVIDCGPGQAGTMADFYSRLLGWVLSHPASGGWAAVTSPEGAVFAFQEVEHYMPPVWPWEAGRQGQMLHLDFYVDDLEEAVRHALDCGARLADAQFFKTSRTMLDPAGHPFCLDTDEPEPQG